MKIKLTENELAKIKANSETINNLQNRVEQLLSKVQAYSKQQARLVQTVRDRVEDCPDIPLEQWDFSQVDWLTYSGEVIIPEPEGDNNGDQ